MRIRVGVNLTWLVPGVVGGSEEATTELLRAVAALGDAGVELRLFALPSFESAHPDLGALPIEVAPVSGGSKVRRVVSDNTWLRSAVAAAALDLVHHAGGVVPPLVTAPSTVTIHDVQPLERGDGFSFAKRLYLRAVLGRTVRVARRVIVPSPAVRAAVVERLGADPRRVDVVPWSVRPPVPIEPGERAEIRTRLGVGSRYLLYPAIAYPHKRHALLLEAWMRRRRHDPELQLVLTGRPGPCSADLVARASAAGVVDGLRVLGRVGRRELDALYLDASCTVFPSAYEGFGLPVAEALAARCPVVAADLAAYDALADGLTLVSGDDPADWAGALDVVLDDESARARLVDHGAGVVAAFTPERTARLQVASWTRALESS